MMRSERFLPREVAKRFWPWVRNDYPLYIVFIFAVECSSTVIFPLLDLQQSFSPCMTVVVDKPASTKIPQAFVIV